MTADPRTWQRTCRVCNFTCTDGNDRSAHRKATRHNDWAVTVASKAPAATINRGCMTEEYAPNRETRRAAKPVKRERKPRRVAQAAPGEVGSPPPVYPEHRCGEGIGPRDGKKHGAREQAREVRSNARTRRYIASCQCGHTVTGQFADDTNASLKKHVTDALAQYPNLLGVPSGDRFNLVMIAQKQHLHLFSSVSSNYGRCTAVCACGSEFHRKSKADAQATCELHCETILRPPVRLSDVAPKVPRESKDTGRISHAKITTDRIRGLLATGSLSSPMSMACPGCNPFARPYWAAIPSSQCERCHGTGQLEYSVTAQTRTVSLPLAGA